MVFTSPDAWATVIAVIMVCISIMTVLADKIEEKRKTETISIYWLASELGASLTAAYIAWEIHPHITFMPMLVTRPVFTVLAIHGGIRFIHAIRNKTIPME